MARIRDIFDPKKTSYSANKNTLGPAWPVLRRSLAHANHVSVKVGEGRGGGGGGLGQQAESPRPVLLNYARGSYHFSFFQNNTKRKSIF